MTCRIENVVTACMKRRLTLTQLRSGHNRRESKTDKSDCANKTRLIPHTIHGSKHNLTLTRLTMAWQFQGIIRFASAGTEAAGDHPNHGAGMKKQLLLPIPLLLILAPLRHAGTPVKGCHCVADALHDRPSEPVALADE